MKRLYTIKYTALACLMAFGISTALKAADAPESESVTKMLADAKRQAFGISLDAATLDSYMRQPKLSWTTHASEIDRMKNDINEEAKTVGKLNDARLGAAPWQTAANALMSTLPPVAALGSRPENSPITLPWSREALVFTTQNAPTRAFGLMTAPAMTALPRPMVAFRPICADG